MELLDGEQIVMSSDKDTLILTNKRIQYDSVALGGSKFISITLDSVASCGLIMKSYPALILIGALALVIALSQTGQDHWTSLILATVFFFAYFFSRQSVLSIASKGGDKIVVPAKSMKRSAITEFLNAVEREKIHYMNLASS